MSKLHKVGLARETEPGISILRIGRKSGECLVWWWGKAPLSITQGNAVYRSDSIPPETKIPRQARVVRCKLQREVSRGHLGPGPDVHWLCDCCSAFSVSPSLPRANSWPRLDQSDPCRFERVAPFSWVFLRSSRFHLNFLIELYK